MKAADQLRILLSGAADVIPVEELEAKLTRGRPLRVKLGIDPSTPDIHIGHAVVLRKLRRFQELGHVAVLIIGDFTGLVGDPSGQTSTRPALGDDELEENARTYLDQVGLVLDLERAEVRRNSEWLGALTFQDVARLARELTVARLLERDDFSSRYREGRSISLVEFLYPLMQGYDSLAVEADVEMGGTDQTFNLLVGRDIQRAHGREPQVAFTMPLLVGTDGERKMSKTYGNHVGLTDPPEEQFGKVMSIPDGLIGPWLRLCTDLHPDEVDATERGLASGSLHPMEQKQRLAREIVGLYHGAEPAADAEAHFNATVRDSQIPTDEIPSRPVAASQVFREERLHVPSLLVSLGLAGSKSEARRLLMQESVRARWAGSKEARGERITAESLDVTPRGLDGSIWTVGKRRFARVARVSEVDS